MYAFSSKWKWYIVFDGGLYGKSFAGYNRLQRWNCRLYSVFDFSVHRRVTKKKKNSRNEFEIEDNVLTIKLGKRKK